MKVELKIDIEFDVEENLVEAFKEQMNMFFEAIIDDLKYKTKEEFIIK